MKFFKWTVPNSPLQGRITKPPRKFGHGAIWLVGGLFFLLTNLEDLASPNGFVKGLQTYFWDAEEGTVLSSDFVWFDGVAGRASGNGKVTYSAELGGATIQRTTFVFTKWSKKDKDLYRAWKASYAPGKTVTVYHDGSGETSLGHWPNSDSYQAGIMNLVGFILGLVMIWLGTREMIRASRVEKKITAATS